VLLISPVRDEASHVDAVVAGVEAQTRPPDLWLVVDDGSADGTRERFEAHAARLPWLRVVSTPPGHTRGAADRLAAAAPDRAWNFGLRQVGRDQFTHLGKLDGDIVLGPGFVEGLLARFRADPRLGMAGGALCERGRGGWQRVPSAPGHVSGACRLYSRICFEQIGGMPERLGADAITIAYAKLRGFHTATVAELEVRHMRPHGSAQGALRGFTRHGTYLWIVHYPLGWILARAGRVSLRDRPRGLSGLWLLGGYLGAALRRVPRVEDPVFRAFVRSDLRARLNRALPGAARRGSGC